MSEKNIKILVADDSKIVRSMVIAALDAKKIFAVDEAENGSDSIKKLNTRKYDIVLLDWNMPELSGKEVLDRIRSGSGLNKNTPIIMITGEVSKKKVLEIARLGVSGYIAKPFECDALVEKILDVVQ